MRVSTLAVLSFVTGALAGGNCGPTYGNKVCTVKNECCSQYGWCDTSAAHCDAKTCQHAFSGSTSSCKPIVSSRGTTSPSSSSAGQSPVGQSPVPSPSSTPSASNSTSPPPTTLSTATSPAKTFPTAVPEIDVCGRAQGGVTCPGAGANGYFYRCCSSAGHCGPKNDIQDQSIYCGSGCQAGYGKCDDQAKPSEPTEQPGTAGSGETCGPIVNKKCAAGLCCSGSNFCGSTADFCGADNWCQARWGQCS